jgi:hypothetical protein
MKFSTLFKGRFGSAMTMSVLLNFTLKLLWKSVNPKAAVRIHAQYFEVQKTYQRPIRALLH